MEKKNSLAGAGLFIAIGLVISAFILSSSMGRFIDQRRFVSVKGLAEREVQADVVSWPILYKEVGNNLSELSAVMDKKTTIITKFLIDNGLSQDEISVSPPEIIDMATERYQANRPTYRYNMTSVLTVTSKKVDVVSKLLSRQGELLRQGVVLSAGDYRYEVRFQYTKLNDIKVDMIKEASANARASAEQFAHDSNSELGKIKDASQGQVSITDRDPNTPSIKQVRVVTSVSYFLND